MFYEWFGIEEHRNCQSKEYTQREEYRSSFFSQKLRAPLHYTPSMEWPRKRSSIEITISFFRLDRLSSNIDSPIGNRKCRKEIYRVSSFFSWWWIDKSPFICESRVSDIKSMKWVKSRDWENTRKGKIGSGRSSGIYSIEEWLRRTYRMELRNRKKTRYIEYFFTSLHKIKWYDTILLQHKKNYKNNRLYCKSSREIAKYTKIEYTKVIYHINTMHTPSQLYFFSLSLILGGIFFSFLSQTYAACTMVCTAKPGGGEKCVSQEMLPGGRPECTTETFPSTADPGDPNDPWTMNSAPGDPGSSGVNTTTTNVMTTEKIPWAECTCAIDNRDSKDIRGGMSLESQCWDPKTRKYVCTVGKWLTGFQNIFREITRWVVYITMLLWVMAIAGAGILWAWGSESEEYTKKAKWWVINILIGLVILFTFRYILWFIAPWIFQ